MQKNHPKLFVLIVTVLLCQLTSAQPSSIAVIGYYAGRASQVDSFDVNKLTHLIYSFGHLKGTVFHVNNANDTLTIQRLVDMKKMNPSLKVMLSLGGWGGCQSCSDVFSTKKNRKAFARSVKEVTQYFKTDGIDLDWEYPAIEGYPGHAFKADDKKNFTKLVNRLRSALGGDAEISFAAGGFRTFLEQSVEWKKVIKKIDRVNLMTYDLVGGYATVTGHHTPLYSNPKQIESTNSTVEYLLRLGIPANKLAIGAAFYGRMWENVSDSSNGLYQQGKFKKGISFKNFDTELSPAQGFMYFWDEAAQAPYLYNPAGKLYVTFDDKRSIELKTKYAIDHRLNGIMFWQLTDDAYSNGLLEVIDQTRKNYRPR